MWWLRLGYNMIWLSGVALAPDQWDFTNTATSGTTLVGGGGVFLHGAESWVLRPAGKSLCSAGLRLRLYPRWL